ncbi:uncharacterized protein ASCRUDRAFT_80627 [Ascoidea rubescens DSM 1968]|uniref:Uncharacterized protein n=1 Tax=Ascoidea rubescens DSM 1968 TaxID=1344418 RepID=A0A1D2VIX0_9ASCO|nr:hypothetical protein ASCRUDRAFT_80627 [Ascoidea rubescens DSM 1968]ODV61572.1 hypothetical protein ASCRUDRAFT_80627 [Ascoidea rubescens DSM 1968]
MSRKSGICSLGVQDGLARCRLLLPSHAVYRVTLSLKKREDLLEEHRMSNKEGEGNETRCGSRLIELIELRAYGAYR